MSTIRRTLAALGLAAAVGAGLAACSSAVPQEDVAASINAKLAELGVTASGVRCPEDLDAEVGTTLRCEYTVDGRPIGVTATVTSVQGDQALYDITSEAPLVSKEDVGAAFDERLAEQGVTPDAPTSCPAPLIGEPGRSVRCEVTLSEQPVDAVATATSAQGTRAEFDLAFEARPVAKSLLDTLIAQQVEQDFQVPIDAADCAGDLAPTVGETVTCTLTSGAESLDLRVAVSAINPVGLVEYTYEPV
jgi:hypothetical protein